MNNDTIAATLNSETLLKIFPETISNDFFEALFGDANEGAYDIKLGFRGIEGQSIVMELQLCQRPGCCLACNLTQGLPNVFSRHPAINVKGIVKEIDQLLGDTISCIDWKLGFTEQRSQALHIIPLHITIET